MPTQQVELPLSERFHGLNKALSSSELDSRESPDTTDTCNYQDRVGLLGPRLGRARIANYTYALTGLGLAVTPWGRYKITMDAHGDWTQVAVTWPGTTPANPTTASVTGMDGTERCRTLQYKYRTYVFNGRNRMREFDGVAPTLAGINGGVDWSAQFTPSVALASTGLTGTYYYYVAAANSKHLDPFGRPVEGIPSNISAVASPANQTVTIANIPSTHEDPQVDTWNIYRTLNGGFDSGLVPDQQDFFFLKTIAIGTTSTTDSAADTTLLDAWRMRFNQSIPPTFQFGAIFGERMFGAGFKPYQTGTVTVNGTPTLIDGSGTTWTDGMKGAWFQKAGEVAKYRIVSVVSTTQIKLDRAFSGSLSGAGYTVFRYPWEIYFSNFGDMEAWGADGEARRNKLSLPGRQAVTGMIPFGGNLLVFSIDAIYVISGQGPDRLQINIHPEPAYFGIGAVSHDSIVRVDNEIHFLSLRGPAKITSSGEPTLYGLQLLTDWLDTLTIAELSQACAGTDGNRVWYSVPVVGQTQNSKTFRYDRMTESWWEEKEMCPLMFVRQDGVDGAVDQLYYLQGASQIRSRAQTSDLIGQNIITGTVSTTTVTLADVTSNVATLTSVGHGLAVGMQVDVQLSDAAYNGPHVITVVATDTFKFALVHADIPSAAVTGTANPNEINFHDSSANFPTSSGGLTESYVRFYRAGVLVDTVRVTSNTAKNVLWSADSTLPGKIESSFQSGDTYEIGNVTWYWTSRTHDGQSPGNRTRPKLNRVDDVYVLFNTQDATGATTLFKTDFVNGTEVPTRYNLLDSRQLAAKYDVNCEDFEYAVKIGSRTGAVVKGLTMRGIQESDNV